MSVVDAIIATVSYTAAQHVQEDLVRVASRPTIGAEVAGAPQELRAYRAEQSRAFLADPDAEDLLAAHLHNAQDPAVTIGAVRGVLRTLAGD